MDHRRGHRPRSSRGLSAPRERRVVGRRLIRDVVLVVLGVAVAVSCTSFILLMFGFD
jgi:hypothetical protein